MKFISLLKLLTKTNNSSTINLYFPKLSGGKKEMDKTFHVVQGFDGIRFLVMEMF